MSHRKHFFMTSTGTGVGKTYVTCALIRAIREMGDPCFCLKPIISGFSLSKLSESDTGRILEALGLSHKPKFINSISPWRYEAPLSPDVAAEREGDLIDFDDLIEFCDQVAQRHAEKWLLVEGVGGVMVPLDHRHTVRDWVGALNFPAVLITGTYLGTISHTLTAVESLRTRAIPIQAIIVNESDEAPMSVEDTMVSLRQHLPAGTPILPLRRDTSSSSHDLMEILRFLTLTEPSPVMDLA